MKKHSLLELNEFIKRVVALNLPETLWIRSEISQIGKSRGTWYIDVIEKDEHSNQILAQAQAMLWARDYYDIKEKKGDIINEILQKGTAILIKVQVEFNERYGLKLIIKNIDTSYTLGALETKRREIITRLMEDGFIGKNKTRELPTVIQRIAIVSSERAAGYHDFINQLASNDYGYKFDYKLFQSAMQGEYTERDVLDALKQINKESESFDIVIVIRGGGSKLDLAAFDNYAIGKFIANAQLPVLTGIGHEIDETIADLVAHTTLKTPTAVADFIINRNLEYETEISQLFLFVVNQASQKIQTATLQIQNFQNQLTFYTNNKMKNGLLQLTQIEQLLPRFIDQKIQLQRQELKLLAKNIELLSPETALKRGFTLTLKDGKPIKSIQDLKKGDTITTITKDGKRDSTVK